MFALSTGIRFLTVSAAATAIVIGAPLAAFASGPTAAPSPVAQVESSTVAPRSVAPTAAPASATTPETSGTETSDPETTDTDTSGTEGTLPQAPTQAPTVLSTAPVTTDPMAVGTTKPMAVPTAMPTAVPAGSGGAGGSTGTGQMLATAGLGVAGLLLVGFGGVGVARRRGRQI